MRAASDSDKPSSLPPLGGSAPERPATTSSGALEASTIAVAFADDGSNAVEFLGLHLLLEPLFNAFFRVPIARAVLAAAATAAPSIGGMATTTSHGRHGDATQPGYDAVGLTADGSRGWDAATTLPRSVAAVSFAVPLPAVDALQGGAASPELRSRCHDALRQHFWAMYDAHFVRTSTSSERSSGAAATDGGDNKEEVATPSDSLAHKKRPRAETSPRGGSGRSAWATTTTSPRSPTSLVRLRIALVATLVVRDSERYRTLIWAKLLPCERCVLQSALSNLINPNC